MKYLEKNKNSKLQMVKNKFKKDKNFTAIFINFHPYDFCYKKHKKIFCFKFMEISKENIISQNRMTYFSNHFLCNQCDIFGNI